MNLYQFLALGGMLSPLLYTFMWILGGYLDPDYDHIKTDVSSLFAVGAPNQRLMQTLIIISSVLLFIFFLGVHEGINDGSGDILGPLLLILSAFLGVLVAIFFPLDAGGEMTTYKGKGHLVLIVGSGILMILGMVALWLRLANNQIWGLFAVFSLISAIIALVLVIITGKAAETRYLGLVERVMVSYYQVYYFVIALAVFLNN